MNRSFPLAAATLAAIASLVVLGSTPAVATGVLPAAQAQRVQLEESWRRQIGAVGGPSAIVDIQLWVQRDHQREYVEVVQNGAGASGASANHPNANRPDAKQTGAASGEPARVLQRIAADLRDHFGNPIGKAEAQRRAKLSVLQLKRRSIDAQIREVSVQQVRLYVLLQDGQLSAYDAETGEPLWAVRIGNPALGYAPLGIDDQYVTVLNGTTMYQVRASDREVVDEDGIPQRLPAGRPLPPTALDNIPLHGAAHSGGYAIVPITRNGIEIYRLDGSSSQPGVEMFTGQPLTQPAAYPQSTRLMWPTNRDFVYAMETDGRPSMLFRLGTQGAVTGGITASSGHRFFFGSTGGRVYGVRATLTGEVLWNQSLGEPFHKAPLVVGKQVLISSSLGNLHSLATDTGEPTWNRPAPRVDAIFAHTGSQLVGRDRDYQMIVIDAASGERTHALQGLRVEYPIINHETDRVYLVSSRGMIQCLRPLESELPVFHREIVAATVPGTQPQEPPAESQPAPQTPSEGSGMGEQPPADPFGGGADPFGGGADPFGGGADPFGGGNMNDPFGN